MSLLGATAMSIGGSLLGGLFNSGIQYRHQKKLMSYQYDLQKQMLDYTNQYNTPINQMRRLRDAGINPNLAVDGVNGVAGSSTPSVSGGSATNPGVRFDVLGAMTESQNLELLKEQTNLKKEEVERQRLDNERTRAYQPYWQEMAQIERMTAGFVSDYQQYHKSNEYYKQEQNRRMYDILQAMEQDGSLMKSIRAEYAKNGIENNKLLVDIKRIKQSISESQQRVELMKKQGVNVDQRTQLLQLEESLKRNGVSWSDNLLYRFLAIIAKSMGIDLSSGSFGLPNEQKAARTGEREFDSVP